MKHEVAVRSDWLNTPAGADSMELSRAVAIHGNTYVRVPVNSAVAFVNVVEPDGVPVVVFVLINIVSCFLRDVMFSSLFLLIAYRGLELLFLV